MRSNLSKSLQSIPAPPTPQYRPMADRVPALCFTAPAGMTEWYGPVMLGAGSLADRIARPEYIQIALDLYQRLTPDEYSTYMIQYYKEGLTRFGQTWRHSDIATVLTGLSDVLQPRRYLEVGVLRGRSACAVTSRTPSCHAILCDMWIPGYAGLENPGPEFVSGELQKVGHRGPCEFLTGNSHEVLPRYFSDHPDRSFDLITVDGDHTEMGATQDLCDVLPRLAVGGIVVFDDLCHPLHPQLAGVWRRLVESDPRFSAWSFEEQGYGVGFAIRKW